MRSLMIVFAVASLLVAFVGAAAATKVNQPLSTSLRGSSTAIIDEKEERSGIMTNSLSWLGAKKWNAKTQSEYKAFVNKLDQNTFEEIDDKLAQAFIKITEHRTNGLLLSKALEKELGWLDAALRLYRSAEDSPENSYTVLAKTLHSEQMSRWVKEDISIDKLSDAITHRKIPIDSSVILLAKYIDVWNKHEKSEVTLLSTLTKSLGGEDNVVMWVADLLDYIEYPEEVKELTTILKSQLFDKWINSKVHPTVVLDKLKLRGHFDHFLMSRNIQRFLNEYIVQFNTQYDDKMILVKVLQNYYKGDFLVTLGKWVSKSEYFLRDREFYPHQQPISHHEITEIRQVAEHLINDLIDVWLKAHFAPEHVFKELQLDVPIYYFNNLPLWTRYYMKLHPQSTQLDRMLVLQKYSKYLHFQAD